MNYYIVDAHMHLGSDPKILSPEGGFDCLLSAMKKHGILRAYSSHYFLLYGRLKEGLDASIEGYEKSEGRIPFFGIFHPAKPSESKKHLDKAIKHPGFIGIKIHPSFHSVRANDPKYSPAWNYAEKNKIPILSHTWSKTENPVQELSLPHLFREHIDSHPDVTFVMGHSGGRGAGQIEAAAMAGEYPNVFLDIAGDIFCWNLLPRLIRAAGAEKIIFGTDWPWFDPMCYLPRIFFSEIKEKDKALILGLNALKVYEPRLYNKIAL